MRERGDGDIYRWYINQPPLFLQWLANKDAKIDPSIQPPDEKPPGTTVRSLRRDRYPHRDDAVARFEELGVVPVTGVYCTATQWYCYQRVK